jgi:hypothetical protein
MDVLLLGASTAAQSAEALEYSFSLSSFVLSVGVSTKNS